MMQYIVTLVIKREDNSIYWTEHFNDQVTADKWLADEMTRPYWDKTWTATKTVEEIPMPSLV